MTETEFNFSEEQVYQAFKRIRNRLKRHYPEEIVIACIDRLHKTFNTHEDYIQELRHYQPWFLLLLIKWSILHGEQLSPDRKHLLPKDFSYIINLFHELNNFPWGPIDRTGIYFFLRAFAFQQFWFSENFPVDRFGRQIRLFANLPSNHYIKTIFFRETGIEVNDFLELTIALIITFTSENKFFIEQSWFSSIEQIYSNGTIKKFLSTVSQTWDGMKKILESEKKVPVSYEILEQTPFLKYPLLEFTGKYYCYSRPLLVSSMQNLIYNIVRSKDTAKFMTEFGTIFERYIEDVLKQTSFTFLTESKLKKDLNSQKGDKVVDFLIIEDDANIFIDAKGVEISLQGMVSYSPEIVKDRAKTSVLKGVEQYYSTVHQIISRNYLTITNKQNYLLIITYKDSLHGNGKDFFDEVAKEKYEAIREEYQDCSFLESSNMYFISIDDFDLLIEAVLSGNNISEILHNAVENDKNIATKKFIFRQHIEPIVTNNKVRYLNMEFENTFNKCIRKWGFKVKDS